MLENVMVSPLIKEILKIFHIFPEPSVTTIAIVTI